MLRVAWGGQPSSGPGWKALIESGPRAEISPDYTCAKSVRRAILSERFHLPGVSVTASGPKYNHSYNKKKKLAGETKGPCSSCILIHLLSSHTHTILYKQLFKETVEQSCGKICQNHIVALRKRLVSLLVPVSFSNWATSQSRIARTHIHVKKSSKWYFWPSICQSAFVKWAFPVFLQEVQTEPVLNALKDKRNKNRQCKTPKESLPSAHLPIDVHQEYSKSESRCFNVNLALFQTQFNII